MSEENKMTEENKKTVIAFIAGLVVGGLLVYIFAQPTDNVRVVEDNDDQDSGEIIDTLDEEDEQVEEEEDATPTIPTTTTPSTPATPVTGAGSIEVNNQDAGTVVTLGDIEFPANEGWIGVRDYQNGQLSGLLGVVRFSVADGLNPSSVKLLRSTVPGREYAVVFYSDNGDKKFSLANDAQLSGTMETFEAE